MSPTAVSISVAAVVLQGASEVPRLSTDMLVVFAIVAGAVAFFVTQRIPLDVTTLAVVVALVVLEPWTTITATEGVAASRVWRRSRS